MLRRIIDPFLSSWALMSRVPLPQARNYSAAGIPCFFPIIGLIVSCFAAAATQCALSLAGDPFIAVVIALSAQYWAFNLFHFDGYLDSMDALFAFKSREDRLAVLSDSHHGSFALFFGVVYILLKVHILQSSIVHVQERYFLLIFFYPLAGRLSPAVVISALKPAKRTGLGAQLGDTGVLKGIGIIAAGIVIVAVTAGVVTGGAGITGLAVSAVAAMAALSSGIIVSLLYRIKIGGFTGDALGFAVEMGELLYLLLFYSLIH